MGKYVFPDWANTDLRETKYGVIDLDQNKCNGCGWCVKICPTKSLEIVDKKANRKVPNQCLACGDCEAICPNGAITVVEACQFPGYYTLVERGELFKPRLKW